MGLVFLCPPLGEAPRCQPEPPALPHPAVSPHAEGTSFGTVGLRGRRVFFKWGRGESSSVAPTECRSARKATRPTKTSGGPEDGECAGPALPSLPRTLCPGTQQGSWRNSATALSFFPMRHRQTHSFRADRCSGDRVCNLENTAAREKSPCGPRLG